MGEAGALTLWRIGPTGMRERLAIPGAQPVSRLCPHPDGAAMLLAVVDSAPRAVPRLLRLGVAPLALLPFESSSPALQRPDLIAGFHQSTEGLPMIAVYQPGASGWTQQLVDAEAPRVVRVDGKLLRMLSLENGALVALSQTANELRLIRYPAGSLDEPIQQRLPDAPSPADGVFMSASPDGQWLAVAASAAPATPESSVRSRVWLISPSDDVVTLEALGRLPASEALAIAPPSTLWLLSRDEASRFDYLTAWQSNESGAWKKTVEHLLPALGEKLQMLPLPPGHEGLALSRQDELSAWTLRGTAWRRHFEHEVDCLASRGDELLAGCANQVHFLDPGNGEILREETFDTGHVIAISTVNTAEAHAEDPDLDGMPSTDELRIWRTDPRNPDSDGDGIADGADPAPLETSPALRLPHTISLSGRAAGKEVRGLPIAAGSGAGVAWRATLQSTEGGEWLRLFPLQGDGGDPLYLAVDPVAGRRGALPPAYIRITAEQLDAGRALAFSPNVIEVSVSASPRRARRALWLCPASKGPSPATDTAEIITTDLLASPPLYLSPSLHQGPYTGDPAEFTIIILPLESAAEGALSQRAATDFLSRGGGLLLVEGGDFNASYLRHWGAPLGLNFDSAQADWKIEAGDSRGEHPWRWSGAAVGSGRIALIQEALLQAAASNVAGGRTTLVEVVDWLCQAGTHPQDLDADGIPDTIEDRNQNGLRDSGETDPLNPDSDGDGLPDGLEDRNANGRTDPGETDPRVGDTDGDGVPDGADTNPLPPYGTPVIDGLEPAEAPAEGRITVLLRGQSLPSGARYAIGGRRAELVEWLGPEAVRLLLPDAGSDTGGAAEVRIDAGSVAGVLPGGFRYLPRSQVRLNLGLRPDGERGTEGLPVTVRVERVSGSPWRHASAILKTAPAGGTWRIDAGLQAGGAQLAPLADDGSVHLLLHNTGETPVDHIEVPLRWVPGKRTPPRNISVRAENVVAFGEGYGRMALAPDSILTCGKSGASD